MILRLSSLLNFAKIPYIRVISGVLSKTPDFSRRPVTIPAGFQFVKTCFSVRVYQFSLMKLSILTSSPGAKMETAAVLIAPAETPVTTSYSYFVLSESV